MAHKRKGSDSIMSKSNGNYVTNSEKRRAEEAKDENKKVFDLIKEGHTNLKIADMAGISYTEVLMYRIAYERRHGNG